jgi:hypothetical protein
MAGIVRRRSPARKAAQGLDPAGGAQDEPRLRRGDWRLLGQGFVTAVAGIEYGP